MAALNMKTGPDDNTIIGQTIIVRGELKGEENLTVLGRVDGNINLSMDLFIEDSGIVKANISVRNCVISGIVVGNISATERVEITPSGRMIGDISAPRVLLNDGASFRGNVDMGDLDSEASVPSSPSYSGRSNYKPSMTSTTSTQRVASPKSGVAAAPAPTAAPAARPAAPASQSAPAPRPAAPAPAARPAAPAPAPAPRPAAPAPAPAARPVAPAPQPVREQTPVPAPAPQPEEKAKADRPALAPDTADNNAGLKKKED